MYNIKSHRLQPALPTLGLDWEARTCASVMADDIVDCLIELHGDLCEFIEPCLPELLHDALQRHGVPILTETAEQWARRHDGSELVSIAGTYPFRLVRHCHRPAKDFTRKILNALSNGGGTVQPIDATVYEVLELGLLHASIRGLCGTADWWAEREQQR